MTRKIDCWYGLNYQSKFQGSPEVLKELVLRLDPNNTDEILVVQYYHKRTNKKWVTVRGFIVQKETMKKSYGLSREYTLEEKQKIEELVSKESLEGKIYFDEGGTRIV